jgi:hypothetical protein
MNNRTRDVVCTLALADSALSYLLWSGLVYCSQSHLNVSAEITKYDISIQ